MGGKTRYSAPEAWAVARPLVFALEQVCSHVEIAGSLRRKKPDVGDIEILFIPRMHEVKVDMFATDHRSMADELINGWLKDGLITKREGKNGSTSWGEKNKLAVHVSSGIPVDFFATTAECWWNALVCRTGGAESNVRLCNAALARGWNFEPYGSGFHRTGDKSRRHDTTSEADVFQFVGLPCLPPERR